LRTGGVIREEFRFLPENAPYRLHAPGPPVASTIRVFGQTAGAYRRFQSGKDYKVESDFTITWLAQGASPAAGAIWPDDGATFYVNYDYIAPSGANPPLTDRNPGSVTRLLHPAVVEGDSVIATRSKAGLHQSPGVGEHLLEGEVGQVTEQVVAVGEVPVERADPDTGIGGDRRHGHPQPLAVHRRRRGADQLSLVALRITARVAREICASHPLIEPHDRKRLDSQTDEIIRFCDGRRAR